MSWHRHSIEGSGLGSGLEIQRQLAIRVGYPSYMTVPQPIYGV